MLRFVTSCGARECERVMCLIPWVGVCLAEVEVLGPVRLHRFLVGRSPPLVLVFAAVVIVGVLLCETSVPIRFFFCFGVRSSPFPVDASLQFYRFKLPFNYSWCCS